MPLTIFYFVVCLLALLYALLFVFFRRGWQLQPQSFTSDIFTPSTTISIVIAARNEADNISNCITSILNNNYPKHLYEIIIVDDFSDDNTKEIVQGFYSSNVQCFELRDFLKGEEKVNSFKKIALNVGIQQSHGKLIITTDADCIVTKNWLRNFAFEFETKNPVMIIAPVKCFSARKLLPIFQSLDFMTMQGITIAVHKLKWGSMSNGANLAFSRKVFDEVKGYEGIIHFASGDDLMLTSKMNKQFPNRIVCLKSFSAIVTTVPQLSWTSFLQQRIRWSSKNGKYNDLKLTAILGLVYLYNVALLLLFVICFFYQTALVFLSSILLLKIAAELFFLIPVSVFFNEKKQLYFFPILQPLHVLYIVCTGFFGFIGKYSWKGRSVR